MTATTQRQQLKTFIVAPILYGACFVSIYIMWIGPNIDTIKQGLTMLLNNECFCISNQLWGYIGLLNPVCRTHNHIYLLFVRCLYKYDIEAYLEIVKLSGILLMSPCSIIYGINSVADAILYHAYASLPATATTATTPAPITPTPTTATTPAPTPQPAPEPPLTDNIPTLHK